MKELCFTYNVVDLVRITLQIYIDNHNAEIDNKAILFANNKVAYHLLDDKFIEKLLEQWSLDNNGETTLFKAKNKDQEQLWNYIFKSDLYAKELNKQYRHGYGGTGVYDLTTDRFIPCKFSEHYQTIKSILEEDHHDLWEKHQDFVYGKVKNTEDVDDFILTKLLLIGKNCNQDFYTLSERKY